MQFFMFIVYMDFLSRPISSSYHVAYRTPRASTTAHYVEAELLSVGLLGLLSFFFFFTNFHVCCKCHHEKLNAFFLSMKFPNGCNF